MPLEISVTLSPKQASDPNIYLQYAARAAGVEITDIALARIVKRSVDARSRSVKVILRIELYIDEEPQPAPVHFDYPYVGGGTEIIIIGSGPAGLFTALRLIENGYRPVILERGKDVSSRRKDIAAINRNKPVDPDSNYAFGEGGAGTFSDGKLFTRSKKRGDYNKALRTLVFHGADQRILFEVHPHIGTDKLPRIISNIRRTITECGGIFHFGTRVEDIIFSNGKASGVITNGEKIEGAAVVIASGHSASDIYTLLHSKGVELQPKAFAMGVRIEHPQNLIDSIQYHMPERGEYLPAASYSLASQVAGRGVYSFCMCPGGFIVPAMTEENQCVVNGMSPSGHNSVWANSGIVTEIRLEDFAALVPEHGVLAGLVYQRQYEQSAKINAGPSHEAPAQRVADFISGKISRSLPRTSYVPGLVSSQFKEWMPPVIYSSLQAGLKSFGNKMRGFATNEAVVVGVESRTSTPVRIPRDPATLAHPQFRNLYPVGEGAGYAGGIISAALDGEKIADSIAARGY